MKNIVFILIGILLYAVQSPAGQETHGGDAIVCTNAGGSVSVEMLDYLEASQVYGLTLDLGGSGLTYLERVDYVLKRLERIDPAAAKRYAEKASSFLSQTAFLDRSAIQDIDDSSEIIDPLSNCRKVQIAVQVAAPKMFEKKYLIDKNLWQLADDYQKAGLVLHEILLEEVYANYYHSNSLNARYYNAVISSKQMDMIVQDPKLYFALLRDANFQNEPNSTFGYYKHNGFHSVIVGDVILKMFSFSNFNIDPIYGVLQKAWSLPLAAGATIVFPENLIVRITSAGALLGASAYGEVITLNKQPISFKGELTLTNGIFESTGLANDVLYKSNRSINNQTLKLLASCKGITPKYLFDNNGSLLSAPIQADGEFVVIGGQKKKLKGAYILTFNSVGELASFHRCK